MKLNFTLCSFIWLFSLTAHSQNITGIWKGYFVQNSFGIYEDRYKFEVQIAQLPNNALKSVTYSYKTTVFYGKAEATGIYTTKTNNILINELKLVDLKIDDKSQPCLMTCYLEFTKLGDMETLTGTFASRKAGDKSDCGSGKVYLEKATTSDFFKEEFVTSRENELKKTNGRKVLPNIPAKGKVATAPTTKKMVKPGAEDNLIGAGARPSVSASIVKPKKENETLPVAPQLNKLPKPEVVRNRDNELVKSITTNAREFTIDLYDNGEIDGDRISVFHNNELIVSNKALTDKPISFTIKADENSAEHEFVMVAENMGSIPPNTALMIITAGGKRYELFVTSTERKNAVVKITYKPE